MPVTFSPKEAAAFIADRTGRACTAKQLRSFIRACDERGQSVVAPVGSGARYAFTADEVHALVAAYARRPITSGTPSSRPLDTLRALLLDVGDDDNNESNDDA